MAEINGRGKASVREFFATWDAWTRKWTCVERIDECKRRTSDETVTRCKVPKTLAPYPLLAPMASIDILALGSQPGAAIAVLYLLSLSRPLLLSALSDLAGCTLSVEFDTVL